MAEIEWATAAAEDNLKYVVLNAGGGCTSIGYLDQHKWIQNQGDQEQDVDLRCTVIVQSQQHGKYTEQRPTTHTLY